MATTPTIYKVKDHNALIDEINKVVTNPPHGCGSQLPLDKIGPLTIKPQKDGNGKVTFPVVFPVEFGTSKVPNPKPPPDFEVIVSSWDQCRAVINQYAAENDLPTNKCGPIKWTKPNHQKARDRINSEIANIPVGPGSGAAISALQAKLAKYADGSLDNLTIWRQDIIDEIRANLALIANCRCGESVCGDSIACPFPSGLIHDGVKVHPSRYVVQSDNGNGTFNGFYEWDASDVLRHFPSGPTGLCDLIFIIISTSGADGLASGSVDQNGNLNLTNPDAVFTETANGSTGDLSGFSFFKATISCGGFQLVSGSPSVRPYTGT